MQVHYPWTHLLHVHAEHYITVHGTPMADLDPLRWLNPSLSVCSTLTCDVIRIEKLNGFVQPGQDLGETHPGSHGAGWYLGEDQEEETREQCFWEGFVLQRGEAAQFWSLTQCCGKASCCNLWLYKGGEWRVEPTLRLYDWYTNAWSCSSIHIFKSC